MVTVHSKIKIIALILVLIWAAPCFAKPKDKQPRTSTLSGESTAQNIARINLYNFGSHVARFGHLKGDNSIAAVFIQINKERRITCITAISIPDGKLIWQKGSPNPANFAISSDVPLQVYDWNQDGSDDLIYYDAGRINVLNGFDGTLQTSSESEQPYSLYILSTNQFGGPAGLILHGRTFNSLLAPDLSTVWRVSNGFSHFPMSVDIDFDGEPELLAGYILLKSNGDILWDKQELGIHNDASAYGDVNSDGTIDLAIATSGSAALVTSNGETVWRGDEFHAQHIVVGSFRPKSQGQQVVTMDRDRAQSGIMRMYNSRGALLWKSSGHGNRAMLSRLDNWIANTPASLLLVSRSFRAPPTLYDGAGRIVEQFPFPPAARKIAGKETFSLHFTQHFDMDSDGLEEIFIYNEKSLWIYRNKAKVLGIQGGKTRQSLPNSRIFNSTFYTGMQ